MRETRGEIAISVATWFYLLRGVNVNASRKCVRYLCADK